MVRVHARPVQTHPGAICRSLGVCCKDDDAHTVVSVAQIEGPVQLDDDVPRDGISPKYEQTESQADSEFTRGVLTALVGL